MSQISFDAVEPKIFLDEGAKMPKRATSGSAGYDLFSNGDFIVPYGGRVLVKTGVYMRPPLGCHLRICSRSGLALEHGVFVLNSPGIIDNDYRGEIAVILANMSVRDYEVKHGDKVAQLILAQDVVFEHPYPILVDSLDLLGTTERGSGGFGSTG